MTRQRLLTVLIAASASLVLAGCGASAPIPGPTGTTSPTQSATTVVAVASAHDPYAGLCKRHCVELTLIGDLPACAGTGCDSHVRRADHALTALRQDMSNIGVTRTSNPDLDDAINKATAAVNDYNPATCVNANTCGMRALTVELTTGTVALILAQ